MKKLFIITSVLAAFAFVTASATIINVPDDYPTIQQGINVSSDGDTVLVQPDTYVENINFNGHNIVLGSLFLTTGDTSYISQTIIDGDSENTVVRFENGEDSSAIISGFTIFNGYNQNYGGGIYCVYNSSPTISNNTISGNSTDYGGGIYCWNANPTIYNNTISGNSGNSLGGGIFCWEYSYPAISNNTISGNSAEVGAGIYCSSSSPAISNNTISGNSATWYGGGIYCRSSSPTINNNTISGNSAADGGGIYCFYFSPTINSNTISGNTANYGGGIYCFYDSYPVVVNTILWANIAGSSGNEIYLYEGSSISITYSDIQGGWAGEGNIDADPLFRDFDNNDFHLQSITNPDCDGPGDSPCIDMGHPDSLDAYLDCQWGLGAERSDMGAYGGNAEPQTDIRERELIIPRHFILMQNYPNPFNPTTTISFALSEPQFVTLKVYDLLGREVQTLVNENRQAGLHNVAFIASDLSSGIYFYHLQAGDYSESKRMVLLK